MTRCFLLLGVVVQAMRMWWCFGCIAWCPPCESGAAYHVCTSSAMRTRGRLHHLWVAVEC
jgi:hypothetical protein